MVVEWLGDSICCFVEWDFFFDVVLLGEGYECGIDVLFFVDCDLVVEVVFEDCVFKEMVFGCVEVVMVEGVILVLNILFILIDDFVLRCFCFVSFLGLYFFNFVLVFVLVEVVCGVLIGDVVVDCVWFWV